MTSRHRTTSSSRKDSYWRPSDSDSDRPRQTMATTQRHNVDQTGVVEASRKNHTSRRVDPADLYDSVVYPRHHHKSKDRSSIAPQPAYYVAPSSSSQTMQYQAQYDLRAYLKEKTRKRSPRSSNERALPSDDVKASRSGHHSRHAYPTTATQAQPAAPSEAHYIPSSHAIHDPTSSSRHHRSRDKDREKTSNRDPEKLKTRESTAERSEDRERRHRRDKERERPSKDKERHKEKDRHKDREGRTLAETQPADAASVNQAYAQNAGVAQWSTDRIPPAFPESTRAPSGQIQPPARAAATTSASLPWAGLTSTGRGAAAPAPEPAYPYASDRDDPPLPIPPPERRRERTSSKPHRSHHSKIPSQQAGQDSGISSSEQEHSVMERTRTADRHHASREQVSLLQRGYSSGPSGSENEKVPTTQKERHKHRKHGESSRHKSRSASVDLQAGAGPTTSQEIASSWYQRHPREALPTRNLTATVDPSQKLSNGVSSLAMPPQAYVPPSGKTTSSVGLTASQRSAPHIVSIRAGQGPADPQTNAMGMLHRIHSGVTPTRQPDSLPVQQSLARPQDIVLQNQGPTSTGYGDVPSSHRLSIVNLGASGSYQPPTQAYPNTSSHPRQSDSNGLGLGVTHGTHQAIPEVVIRPPSTVPVPMDPYTSRTAIGSSQPSPSSGQSSGRLQGETRPRTATVPAPQPTGYLQVASQPPYHPSAAQHGDEDLYRLNGTSHTKLPSHDLSSRFPVYDDTTAVRPLASGSSASPKRGLTYPGASAPPSAASVHVNPSNYYDQRSSKPPSLMAVAPDAVARLQSHPSGSPAIVGHAVSAASSNNTPKHSPSVRLQSHRNGSNDTITHAAPTKQSPSGSSQQHLSHRTSANNLQTYASSRPENITTSRPPNALPAYPEQIRYRSPAPTGYPSAPTSSSINTVAAPNHSQAYSTQTPVSTHDYQQGRYALPTQPTQTTQHVQGYAPQQGRGGQSVDYGLRSQEPTPTQASFPLSSSAKPSVQRLPSRSAPSPAPTVRPPRLNSLSSPSSRVPVPLHSAPPQPTRNQTYPAPNPNVSATTPFPTTVHTRTASDPQYAGRTGNGYASASFPTRGQSSSRHALSSQNDLLLTPSSLAPSNLPPPAPVAPLSRTESKNSSKEKEGKRRGFFGLSLFRSRSSPPKPREVNAPPPSAAVREKRERNVSQPTQPSSYMQASNVAVKGSVGPPDPPVSVPVGTPQTASGYNGGPVPITAPTPVAPGSGRNSNGKIFTPFRLLSRRHHTVSTASVEAVDGTVINAMLTGGDSTRSSTAGRPSPPLRDPLTAAQEWRNLEEYQQQGRGTLRRRRPGVTFDIDDAVPEDGRPSIQKSMRANVQANMQNYQAGMTAGQAPLPTRQATA